MSETNMTLNEYCADVREMLESSKRQQWIENVETYGGYSSEGREENVYKFKHLPEYETVFRDFDLPNIAGSGDTFSKAVNVMQWITDHTYYCGMANMGPALPDKILKTSYDKGFDGAINCANKSILLADALVSIGIFAMPVWLANNVLDPDSEWFLHTSCHAVVHVYAPELGKWVLLDPTANTYYTVKGGETPLNLIELQNSYREGKEILLNGYNFNGSEVLKELYLWFTMSALMEITIFPGNDYAYRYNWGDMLCLMPGAYKASMRDLLDNPKLSDDERGGLDFRVNHARRMSLASFLAKPVWAD